MAHIWAWGSAPGRRRAGSVPWGRPCRDLGSAHALQPPGAQPLSRVRPRGPLPSGFPLGLAAGSFGRRPRWGGQGCWGAQCSPLTALSGGSSWEPPGPRAFRPGLAWTTLPAPQAGLFLRCPPPGTASQLVFVELPPIVPVGMDPLFLARPQVVQVTISSPWKQHGIKLQKSNGMGDVCVRGTSRPESGSGETAMPVPRM